MKRLIIAAFGFVCLTSSCGTVQKLEQRIVQLEEENKQLKTDVQLLKGQMGSIINQVLPKPNKSASGGARPIEEGVAQQFPDVLTAIQLPEVQHDFGTISKNSVVSHEFIVKNVGTQPLIIQNAIASCGCTVPEWTKSPIPVGKEGRIKVTFNTTGKKGVQNKYVTITANTDPANTRLYIKATLPK